MPTSQFGDRQNDSQIIQKFLNAPSKPTTEPKQTRFVASLLVIYTTILTVAFSHKVYIVFNFLFIMVCI